MIRNTMLAVITLFCHVTVHAQTIQLSRVQLIKDNESGIDGLDNPRKTLISPNGRYVYLTSGDDNSFAVFDVKDGFQLTLKQVFLNASSNVYGLEGASGISYLPGLNLIAVSGFYDGALSLFSHQQDGTVLQQQILSDRLGYDRVFDNKEPVGSLDKLGLLGAWDVVSASVDNQFYVSSYMSNELAVFTANDQGKLDLHNRITRPDHLGKTLGKPIGLALSKDESHIFVLGFDTSQLTIFKRNPKEKPTAIQLIDAGKNNCLNPQQLVANNKASRLYLACAGSKRIALYARDKQNDYRYVDFYDANGHEGHDLAGASSLALTSDGTQLFAAGEGGNGLLIYNVSADGSLSLINDKNLNKVTSSLRGISSLTLSRDDQFLLVTEAKKDTLTVFKVTLK